MPGRLQGRKVLVTGSGTGIGREVALEIARQGADVILHYSSSKDGAESAMAEARQAGVRADACRADLGIAEECFRLVDFTVATLGGIDVLVNNSGITHRQPFLDVTPEQFDRVYNVNMRGQYFCAQQAVRYMLTQEGGVIINMTSVHAFAAMPLHSVYAGTKGAIVAWTRELAIELAPTIRVNAIAAGWIDVPRQHQSPGYNPDRAKRTVPAARTGQPLDIAKACVYVASDDASFMTGQTLVIDGGTTAWMSLAAARSTAC
jgi:NAD(P)-dependent dehydrogenase (short-subunit alcohol dehydrogenase family)